MFIVTELFNQTWAQSQKKNYFKMECPGVSFYSSRKSTHFVLYPLNTVILFDKAKGLVDKIKHLLICFLNQNAHKYIIIKKIYFSCLFFVVCALDINIHTTNIIINYRNKWYFIFERVTLRAYLQRKFMIQFFWNQFPDTISKFTSCN